MLLFLENIMQTVMMICMLYSAYSTIFWYKKDKFGVSLFSLVMFLVSHFMYQALEYMA